MRCPLSCIYNISPGDQIYFHYQGNIRAGYVIWEADTKEDDLWWCHSVSINGVEDRSHTTRISAYTVASPIVKIVKAKI